MNWIRRLWIWIKDARLLWLCLAVIIGALLTSSVIPIAIEAKLRVAGMFLQLSGVMTVAWGISETRKLFGRPSILRNARKWLNQFPPFRLKHVIVPFHGVVEASSSASARLSVWGNAPPNAALEERVQVLEKNLVRVKEASDVLEKKLHNEVRTRDASLSNERDLREKADNDIRAKLETTETGGLYISLIGIVWLCLGLILGTVPAEIISFLITVGLRSA